MVDTCGTGKKIPCGRSPHELKGILQPPVPSALILAQNQERARACLPDMQPILLCFRRNALRRHYKQERAQPFMRKCFLRGGLE